MKAQWALFASLGLVLAGCGGSANQSPSKSDLELTALSDVGELYRLYTQEKKKPPTKLSDFTPMEMMSPTGVRAIKTGEVVVQYGAVLPDTAEGPPSGSSNEVLAYMKEVPEKGGQVLMLNRSIKTMTAEEFKAAPKAGTTNSATPASGKAK